MLQIHLKYWLFMLLWVCALFITQPVLCSTTEPFKVQKGLQNDAIKQSINTKDSSTHLTETISVQKSDLKKQKELHFFERVISWLSVALIIILSLLTYTLYKNNKLRAKSNKLLKYKNIELQAAKDKAESASQAKAQFLSTITHELRTPLFTVTGLTHLLLEENPKPEQKEHLNSLKFSGEYLLLLINNILDLNKLEASKVEVASLSFNLEKKIERIIAALKSFATSKNNTIHFEYDKTIPSHVIGDSLMLSQILMNLLSNAIKFTENGDIWLRVNNKAKSSENIIVQFEIEDTGDGISKEKQTSIFESFTQGSLNINRKYGGTGLGLAIVKNILELNGSKIFLKSKLGKGSKFWFDLNYGIIEKNNKAAQINKIEVVLGNEIFHDKTVLIVEDNKINQMITKKILEKKKMICTIANNGQEAIEFAKKENYDIILMDLHLPEISGVEATKTIREFNKTTPIIALTAITFEEGFEKYYKVGFNEYIPKPFNVEEFYEKINRNLKR